MNCQSLLPHFLEFNELFHNSDYDMIAMSETWLKPHVSDILVNLPGFYLLRHDRVGRGGGGIGIFIRVGATARVLAVSAPGDNVSAEYIIVSVSAVSYENFTNSGNLPSA